MADILSHLSPPEGAKTSPRRIGRGVGSGLGKTSGRGQKGQKARSKGNINKLHFQGGQTPIQRRLPKRGFRNPLAPVQVTVSVGGFSRFKAGDVVDETSLRTAGLLKGQFDKIKVLSDGELTIALTVIAHNFSAAAKTKIEKAGGKIQILPTPVEKAAEKKAAKTEEKPAEKKSEAKPAAKKASSPKAK